MSLKDFLEDHNYREALLHAQAILAKNPDDIFARFVFGYALYQLEGNSPEAVSIIKEAQEDAFKVVQMAGSITANDVVIPTEPFLFPTKGGTPSAPGGDYTPGRTREREFASSSYGELPAEFYTTSMAELLYEQGHIEMARDIIAIILQREVDNKDAQFIAEKIAAEIQSEPNLAQEITSRRLAVLNKFLAVLEKHNRLR